MTRTFLLAGAVVALASVSLAAGDHGLNVREVDPGSVDQQAGLEAWDRIHAVVSHPRCANCHVDAANIPLWTDGQVTRPHGMNIRAGDSRIGAELLPCQTCHVTSTLPNVTPHAAPHAGLDWQLAPVEFLWTGKTTGEICAQMRDPERNGGRDGDGLIEHILHDVGEDGFIAWGFDPGPGRDPAPGTLQAHLDDTINWVAASMPCPQD